MEEKTITREKKPKLVNPNPPDWKDLKVEMMDNTYPKVSFNGKWMAKDVSVVLAAIKREYLLYQRSLRRKGLFARGGSDAG